MSATHSVTVQSSYLGVTERGKSGDEWLMTIDCSTNNNPQVTEVGLKQSVEPQHSLHQVHYNYYQPKIFSTQKEKYLTNF